MRRPLVSPAVFSVACALAATAATVVSSSAQEVRRAEPVNPDQVPTARAEPFYTPTPAPIAPAAPVAPTPTPVAAQPSPPEAPTPPPAPPESPDEVQLDYANKLYAHASIDLAAPEYEKYLASFPTAPDIDRESAMFRLGECYRRVGNLSAARTAYQNLLLNFGEGDFIGPAAYRLGDMDYEAKDYDGALNYFRKASVHLTDPAVALAAKFYSARCLEAENLPSEARITYQDIVDTSGTNPYREPSRLALAEILSSDGQKDDALTQFDALAKEATQPGIKAEALVKAGMLNIDLSHPEQGAGDLNAALKIPEIGQLKPIAEMGLLRVLYSTGKYQDVVNQYQGEIGDLPGEMKAEVLLLAANSKNQLNDFAGASVIYQELIKEYPTSSSADEARYKNLVSIYNAGGQDIIPRIDEFLAGKHEAAQREQVTLMKAEALMKQKKFAEAAPVYGALQNSGLSAALRSDALFKEGFCYIQVNEPEKGIDALSDFLKDFPLSKMVPTALAQRALAYQTTKPPQLDPALHDYNELLRDYPKAKERELALQQKGLILGEQQDNPGMADAFQQLLKEYPHTTAAAQANYWIGSAAYSAKDYKACIAPLKAARKLDTTQFFERASIRIIDAEYYLNDRDALASEIDLYNNGHPQDKVQPEVIRWLGQSYLEAKDYTNSVKYLVQLSLRAEATPDDWLTLARAQLGARDDPDAITSVGKFIAAQADPAAQAKGYLVLGQAQLDSNLLDNAQTSADKACSLQPEGLANGQGRMLAGDIAVARADFDSAAKIFQSIAVILDDPKLTPQAMEKAYECLNKEGNSAEAAKVLNQLQTKYPEYQVKTGKADGQ